MHVCTGQSKTSIWTAQQDRLTLWHLVAYPAQTGTLPSHQEPHRATNDSNGYEERCQTLRILWIRPPACPYPWFDDRPKVALVAFQIWKVRRPIFMFYFGTCSCILW